MEDRLSVEDMEGVSAFAQELFHPETPNWARPIIHKLRHLEHIMTSVQDTINADATLITTIADALGTVLTEVDALQAEVLAVVPTADFTPLSTALSGLQTVLANVQAAAAPAAPAPAPAPAPVTPSA